ncbi:MAG: efflux RND transporter permease subunit, partial [Alphaproteobacteria bacterium]|nr:efflux RND transporter permease subunit [Alphaproteobacteria bacterium]
MLKAIVHFSLKYRGVVLALSLVLLGYGFYDLRQAQYDVFPEFAPPQAVIQTEAPGLSPEQVEMLVTQPIENAVNGVSGIRALRSQSIQGLSVIQVVFGLHSDIYRDRQIVAERLTTVAGSLPQGVNPPILTPLTSSISTMYGIGLTSDRLTPMQLRTQADWVVKQRLLAVPGVAKVAVFGGDVRQLQIQILPDKLRYYNLSFEDVVAVARKATGIEGAGFIDTSNQRITLQTYGQMSTPEQLARTPIVRGSDESVSLNITLGDVAKIAEAPAPPIGAATVMGKNGIIMLVSSQYGANTLELDHKIEAAMAELKPALKAQGITVNENIFRPAHFIEVALGNVRNALLIGAALVIAVLFLFLNNARTALISAAAIPLSLLTAASVLHYFGLSLNTMTLGGLAIAIGEVVDDAVIDVENILRRLRENRALGNPKSRLRTMLDASLEVRSAVVFATFAVVLVFVPVMTIGGLGGSLFAPLGFAYISAILASLAVALTVTPALCMLFLRANGAHGETRLVLWLKASYRRWLEAVERAPRSLLIMAIVLTLASLASLPFMTGELIPELQEGHYIVRMMAIPGTSLQETIRIGDQVTHALLKLPFVRSVTQQAGRAELGDDTTGTNYSEFQVDLKPLTGDAAEQAPLEIKKALTVFPGVNFAVNSFLAERVDETISGYTAGVVLNIYGNNL